MPHFRLLTALLVAVVALACGDPSGNAGADGSLGPNVVAPPREIRIGIGEELALVSGAYVLSDEPADQRIVWTTSDSTIVVLLAGTFQSAVGLREGNASLTATGGAKSVSFPIVVRADATALVIEDFHVVEDSYPGDLPQWAYAPKLRLRPSTTRPAAAILGWEVVVPGIDERWGCRSNVTLSSASSFELFAEAYGDYAFQSGSNGKRATPGAPASIRVTLLVRDTTVYARAWGPIVPAVAPPAYDGRMIAGLCVGP